MVIPFDLLVFPADVTSVTYVCHGEHWLVRSMTCVVRKNNSLMTITVSLHRSAGYSIVIIDTVIISDDPCKSLRLMSTGSVKETCLSKHPLNIPIENPTTPTKRKLSTSPAAILTSSTKQQKTGSSPPVLDANVLGIG